MAQTPVDISGVLPGSISEDDQVQDMATAVAVATMDPALPKVLRRHIDELSEPPHEVLDAIARHFDADVWDEDWDKGQKRENLRTILRWHELKGTPEGLRLTFERDGVPDSRIFEEWPRLEQWLYYQDQRRLDETALDTEALDFEPNSFFRDASLSTWEYWAALRPGWGPGADFKRAADLTERTSAIRVGLKVPSVEPAADVTTSAGGRYSAGEGFSVDGPDGELVVGEGLTASQWAISAWADVSAASMDAGGVLVAAHRNRASHAAIRRSGSTTEFELHVQTGGTDHYISPSFTLGGWHYLTLRRDGSEIAALDGDRLLASATVPKFSSAWQPAIGSRPGSSNYGPDRHANTRRTQAAGEQSDTCSAGDMTTVSTNTGNCPSMNQPSMANSRKFSQRTSRT